MTASELWYCPEWGSFYRNGKRAGWLENNGFVRLYYKGKTWSAHRLAYLFMKKKAPNEIDHINRNRQDNSWGNLRGVSSRQNSENRSSNNDFIGVARDGRHWRAYSSSASLRGRKDLGRFKTHFGASYARWSYDQTAKN